MAVVKEEKDATRVFWNEEAAGILLRCDAVVKGNFEVKGRRTLPPASGISTARWRCIGFLRHHPWSVVADDSIQRILHKNKFFAVYITRQKITLRRQRQECVKAKKKKKKKENIWRKGKTGNVMSCLRFCDKTFTSAESLTTERELGSLKFVL
ncbi:hypothetical protein CDAR_205941 [Caerostris darwini]|uniref:Uncharacterized protein n=1 Tax=Caerostris darwini TaxID=1538125 RepID=A0AAV4WJS9_9ARAC|nr:hypothetical protein CDAR_205941 [Caerostris darwini]